MYFDWTYLVLVVPAMIFAMWASNRVDKTFEKYQLQHSAKRITGAEAAFIHAGKALLFRNE